MNRTANFHHVLFGIENLNNNEILDPLGQAWLNGSASAAKTPGRATVNKHRLCGSLF